MPAIYCLETDGFVWYVGSTKNPKDRERRHRNKSAVGYGASLIPDMYEWSFTILENCDEHDMKVRERYWIETLHPLNNKIIPSRTQKEFAREWAVQHHDHLAELTRNRRAANHDSMIEYERAYRDANRERVREYARRWAAKNRLKKAAESLPPS